MRCSRWFVVAVVPDRPAVACLPGELADSKVYNFEFANVEKQHETYSGNNVRLRCVFVHRCCVWSLLSVWLCVAINPMRCVHGSSYD
jgi:hypothetical protein